MARFAERHLARFDCRQPLALPVTRDLRHASQYECRGGQNAAVLSGWIMGKPGVNFSIADNR